jgi:hypothetical protein
VLAHNLNQQNTPTNISNIAIKAYLQEIIENQKVFVGPHFGVTKHRFNLATKVGVLQWISWADLHKASFVL